MNDNRRRCPSCSEFVGKHDRFCTDCGGRLTSEPEHNAVSSPPQQETDAFITDPRQLLDPHWHGGQPQAQEQHGTIPFGGADAPQHQHPAGTPAVEPGTAPKPATRSQPAPHRSEPAKERSQPAPTPVLRIVGHERSVVIPRDRALTIGTGPGCDVVLADDVYVSGRHAKVSCGECGLILEDAGSTNGTHLRVKSPHLIKPGDEFRIGTTVLRIDTPTASN